MNKKVLLLIAVLLCGIGSEAVAQEKSKTWTLQAGIGYGQTEYLGDAFASGFYVGKRLANVIEVGFTMYNLLSQKTEYGFSYAEATALPYHYLEVAQYEDATWKSLNSGSSTSFMAVAGFSPIKLIWKNSRHDLVLAGQAGLSYKNNNYLYMDVDNSMLWHARMPMANLALVLALPTNIASPIPLGQELLRRMNSEAKFLQPWLHSMFISKKTRP